VLSNEFNQSRKRLRSWDCCPPCAFQAVDFERPSLQPVQVACWGIGLSLRFRRRSRMPVFRKHWTPQFRLAMFNWLVLDCVVWSCVEALASTAAM